ncbi:response regulator [Clostridium autoethanogenum]|jgi:DNA-binding NarL/FixJ family response regulator|uniref:Stage 0 sporulation protein A homolog n=1 Tax=Clostridium autoethanogenum DSM 10061 TaxID=1341692 RepID=A0ABM5NZW7_9CLOT|nr:response regulator [Clostridium autoethanogenum]AGY78218.1 response regulator [Clostridium autoethanogenum DSM 10061]ALU38350.1 Response regulator receiver protein [Clostridium autoethanogenum DSM 10061]OVY51113.1 Chemotaxis protein CheY [Clostridium autoethanogenum]
MKDIKVVVVDDSPFSIALLRDMLTDNGFDVVGEATSLEETIEVVGKLRPNIVTMDMTIPGTDGIECTKAIHSIDPNINVIIVSSMMDDEIVKKAKKNHACGYIQKPVDPEELTLLINRIMADDELFNNLDEVYYKVYKESFMDVFNKLMKTVPKFGEESNSDVELVSRGISVVMGIIGKYSGRMLLDMSYDTAEKLSEFALRRKPKNAEEMLNIMGEICNMVAGNASSVLNRKNKLLGLRVAPPSIFYGNSINISKAELDTTTSSVANTEFGEIYVNVGFQRRSGEWMSNI